MLSHYIKKYFIQFSSQSDVTCQKAAMLNSRKTSLCILETLLQEMYYDEGNMDILRRLPYYRILTNHFINKSENQNAENEHESRKQLHFPGREIGEQYKLKITVGKKSTLKGGISRLFHVSLISCSGVNHTIFKKHPEKEL